MGVQRVLVVQEGVGEIVREFKYAYAFIAGDDVVDVLRVEVLQLFLRDADDFAYLAEIKVLAYLEGIGVGWHLDRLRYDAVFLVVRHRVERTDKGRHISASLLREKRIDRPEILAPSGALDGFVDISRSAVVGGYGQAPVSENVVLVEKIPCSGIRRLLDVQTLVHVRVDPEPVGLGGVVHELPHSLGPGAGDRNRVECGLDDGHGLEFLGQAVAVEDVFEDRKIVCAQTEDMSHLGWHFLRIEHHVVLDRFVEGERDVGVHLLQPLDEDGIRHVRSKPYGVHVILREFPVGLQLAVYIPQAEQAVGHLGAVFLHQVFLFFLKILFHHLKHPGRKAVDLGFLQTERFELPDERVHPGTQFGVLLEELTPGLQFLARCNLRDDQQ